MIPTILEIDNGHIAVDGDFANNLAAYLRHFDRVEVFCPPAERVGSFPSLVDPETIIGSDRLNIEILPQPYREDRYLRHRAKVKRQLTQALERSRYRLISPHAPLSWSSLAAQICVSRGLKFDFEADWDLATTSRFIISQMPRGLKKFHHKLRLELHLLHYRYLLRNSAVSLVQGQDVMEAYKDLAPNIHAVLNVQITARERITSEELDAKVNHIGRAFPLRLTYAGRASEIKGPFIWLATVKALKDRGVPFLATWLGEGELIQEMRNFVSRHGLDDVCKLPGATSKDEVYRHLKATDLFMFCHMGYESPRNLMEAVANGAPLCGFGTPYSRGLVAPHGGGAFVERGDIDGLTDLVVKYHHDRNALIELVHACAKSGTELDRDKAIERRIALLKEFL